MWVQKRYIYASSAEVTAPGLNGGFFFRGLKKLKSRDSWIHSTAQRKEHSKTEFRKKNPKVEFGESETFYQRKFSPATSVTVCVTRISDFRKFRSSRLRGFFLTTRDEGVQWRTARVLGLCSRAARMQHSGSALYTYIVLEAKNPGCAAHIKRTESRRTPCWKWTDLKEGTTDNTMARQPILPGFCSALKRTPVNLVV